MPKPKYTFEQVQLVRKMLAEGKTFAEIRAVVPMSHTRVSMIKSGVARRKR